MVDRRLPRVQEVLFPVLRAQFPGVTFTSWYADVDHRTYPFVNVRRLGGLSKDAKRLDKPVIEMTVYTRYGLVAAENLYLDVREVIWDMVRNQTVTPAGYLHSFFETMGPTPFDSGIDDTWRVQGLIQLGVRPPRLAA
ncbi:hypothetical protein [Amycolatopsis anabasis]|uniref:hypothetical protein n=1 Tax=Amycolatopsis anabasis TaxID=1840409 RepID=UPI00131D0FC9|nr:hypothetical protein [Amycolatopsis anabasis]